jgi:hypothetical protein
VTGTPEEELDPLLAAVTAATPAEEQRTLGSILESGLDQGWFLRPSDDLLLNPTPAELVRFYNVVSARDIVRPTCPDPWATSAPAARPIPGPQPGWVILTQRCDLIGAYANEPLVEFARATQVDGPAAATAKANSARSIAFADAGGGALWAADLRQRVWLPKTLLLDQPDLTPAIEGDRAQKRFRLRLGQRYWRDPVPDDLVDALQRPLRDAVKNSAQRIATLRNFTMLLGLRNDDGRVLVLAVAEEGRETEAESDWGQLMELLRRRAPGAHALIDADSSGVYTHEDISLGLWLDSFKFDFDELTYSRRADPEHATPER